MNYNRIFSIDFSRLATLITPIDWRKNKFLSFIWACMKPINELKGGFDVFRQQSIYKVVHNGQVGLLEKVLNDSFDNEERRIYITDSLINDAVYIYRRVENKPLYLYRRSENNPVYIYRRADAGDINTDFYVVVPLAIKPASDFATINFENQIKGQVNYYKLGSKRYKIIYE